MRGTTGDIRQLDLGLMKSPYAGSRCKHSVTRHLQVLLISSFKKYRLSSGDIWDDLQTLEDARWESRFSFFFALRPCCCHCSKSANQEHDPLGPCRGKDWNYIALMSGLFWAPTESDRGQAAGSSHSFVLSAGDPSCPRYHCCLTGLHTAPATLQPVEECCVRHPQVSVLALPTRSRCVLRLVQTLTLRGRSCCPDRQLAYQYKLGWSRPEINWTHILMSRLRTRRRFALTSERVFFNAC